MIFFYNFHGMNKLPRGKAIEVLQGIVYFPGVWNFAPRFAEAATRFACRNVTKAGKAQRTARVPLKL